MVGGSRKSANKKTAGAKSAKGKNNMPQYTTTIWVMMQMDETGDQFIEDWSRYIDTLTEEDAVEEVINIVDRFNTHRRAGESKRTPISFVLEKPEIGT